MYTILTAEFFQIRHLYMYEPKGTYKLENYYVNTLYHRYQCIYM